MSSRDRRLSEILEHAVARSIAPAATAWIWHDGSVVASGCAGATDPGPGGRVRMETLFDVASLTKPAVASLALRLVASGRASPADVVVREPSSSLWEVLSHRAGFEAWLPLWEQVEPGQRATPAGRRIVIDAALRSPRAEVGTTTIYSDLGYIALMPWLENRAGTQLGQAIARHVTGPLGLTSTGYRPVAGPLPAAAASIAPTEVIEGRGLASGEVHDDNAWAMGGVSAHAGLFSTAEDMGRLGVAFLEARAGRPVFLPAELAGAGLTPTGPGEHTIAWDTKSPAGSSAGSRFSPASCGHLGFTGCSIWIDPDALVVAVLLTNRIHPTRHNESIRDFRPAFHDAVFDDILA